MLHKHCLSVSICLLLLLFDDCSLAFIPSKRSLPPHEIIDARCNHRTITSALRTTSSNTTHDPHLQAPLLEKLSCDLEELSLLRPPDPSADTSVPVSLVSAGSSYTRIWTHKTWQIHSNPPHRRYARHVLGWTGSTTARKILPAVLFSSCWACLLSLAINRWSGLTKLLQASGAGQATAFLTAPLVLLLTLRANASMSRLVEARLMWGRLVLHARSLSSLIRAYLYPHAPEASVLIIRYLSFLGWSLKAFVRGEDESSQLTVLETMLGSGTECHWISSQRKPYVAIPSRIRQIYGEVLSSMALDYAPAFHFCIEERIAELESCVGACERLFGSPIPPTYSRHLSRVMLIWMLLMPISLVANGLSSTIGVTVATMTTAYVLVGIDEVGMEIENAFQLLPLQQLAGAVQNDVRDQFFVPSVILNDQTAISSKDNSLSPEDDDISENG